MAAAFITDQTCQQQRVGLPSPPSTPAHGKGSKIESIAGSLSSLLDEQVSGSTPVVHAEGVTEPELISNDIYAPSQGTATIGKNESIFGSLIKPIEDTIDHGWTRLDASVREISFKFADITKATYGVGLASPVIIAVNTPTRPSELRSERHDGTANTPNTGRPNATREDVNPGKGSPAKGSSGSKGKIKTPKQKNGQVATFQEKLEWILPTNTVARLFEDTRFCTTTTIKHKTRCARKAKTPFRNIADVEGKLSKAGEVLDEEAWIDLVGKMMKQSLCTWHMNERIPVLTDIRQDLAAMSDDKRTALRSWIKALLTIPEIQEESPISVEHDSESSSSSTTEISTIDIQPVVTERHQRPITRSMTAQARQIEAKSAPATVSNASYIQRWESYKPNKAHAPNILIKSLLTRRLLKSEKEPGSIYMYWYPPNFGYVKIGRTGKEPEERFKEWEKQCKHPVEDANRQSLFVKHVALVEKLVHAEMRDRRYREVDCVCGIKHQEWFKVQPAQAMKVLNKFAAYMDQEPYGKVEDGSDQLPEPNADLLNENVRQLCKLVDIDAPERTIGPKPSPQRRSLSRRRSSAGRSSPRYSLRSLV